MGQETERSGMMTGPIMLVGLIFTALIGAGLLTYFGVVQGEGWSAINVMVSGLRCILMGPMM